MAQRPIEGREKESGDQWIESLSCGKRTANNLASGSAVAPGVPELLTRIYSNPYEALANGNDSIRAGDLWLSAAGKKMVRKSPHVPPKEKTWPLKLVFTASHLEPCGALRPTIPEPPGKPTKTVFTESHLEAEGTLHPI
eukprot:jgi/Botrbrau1/12945/Bobra.154_2s0006.1